MLKAARFISSRHHNRPRLDFEQREREKNRVLCIESYNLIVETNLTDT